jgi:hypothetical protein
MKRTVSVLLFVVLAGAAFGAAEPQAIYLGGTSKVAAGSSGSFDTTNADQLTFESAGGKVVIPYRLIDSFESSTKLAHHLGALPFVAVTLVAPLHRRHYLRISYRDEQSVMQVAIFEIAKEVPRTIVAILEVRAPKQCKTPSTCALQRRD